MMKNLTLAAGALIITSSAAMAQSQLTIGTPAQGSLAAGDSQLPTGEYYDEYAFQGEAGQSVSIRMDSTEFDTYLIYMDPNGANQSDNDDLNGTNAGLDVTLQSSGLHRVGATSYAPGTTGNYTIGVYQAGQAPAPAASTVPTMPSMPAMPSLPIAGSMAIPPTVAPVGVVAVGTPVTGQLAQGDAALATGQLVDVYTIDVTAGQTLNIQLNSPAGPATFDTLVIYQDPSGAQQENDDVMPGQNLNSALTVTAQQAGTARIGVTSFAPSTVGDYTLTVN